MSIVIVLLLAEKKAFFAFQPSLFVRMRSSSLASLLSLCSFSLVSLTHAQTESSEPGEGGAENYKIEGKVTPPDNPAPDWLSVTSVTLDGGKRRAFLRDDHSFVFQVCMSQIIVNRRTFTSLLCVLGFGSWKLSCRS